jgi:hypothetical protein
MLLGQSLMARDFDRQVAEIQIRIAALNCYTTLGIPITEAEGQVRPEKAAPTITRFVQQNPSNRCAFLGIR